MVAKAGNAAAERKRGDGGGCFSSVLLCLCPPPPAMHSVFCLPLMYTPSLPSFTSAPFCISTGSSSILHLMITLCSTPPPLPPFFSSSCCPPLLSCASFFFLLRLALKEMCSPPQFEVGCNQKALNLHALNSLIWYFLTTFTADFKF